MNEYYIGLLSGTSMDGVDVALIDFATEPFSLVGMHHAPYEPSLRNELIALSSPQDNEIHIAGELDRKLGVEFSKAVEALLEKTNLSPDKIKAIGNHGQTIRHSPNSQFPFTIQIADPNTICAMTNITTISDFRRRDIALGGQGAPLTPAFHKWCFHSQDKDRIIVNIGGMCNITYLPKDADAPLMGFDTGPGNVLLDHWIFKHLEKPYDEDGAWGQSGQVNTALLQDLLNEAYFQLPPPKTTGREKFNAAWLQQHLVNHQKLKPEDIQATLMALTAQSLHLGIQSLPTTTADIIVCGGGAYNKALFNLLKTTLDYPLQSSKAYGLSPEWVEAVAFAWLAKQTLEGIPANLPEITGAVKKTVLGGIYTA